MQRNITVMVTGIGGGSIGEQLIKSLRLAATKYEIVGGDVSPYSKGLLEVDIPYVLPPASDTEYLPSLIKVCRKHNVKALFVGSEAELKVVSRQRKIIQDTGVFLPINSEEVIETCLNKSRTMELLQSHGFSVPRSLVISSLEMMEEVDFFPVVLKPIGNSSGSADVFIAQNPQELLHIASVLFLTRTQLLLQEYVGSADSEYTVGVLLSMQGELINSIALKRNLLSGLSNRAKVPNRTGKTELGQVLAISSGVSQGEIGVYPEVTKTCEKIALLLNAKAAINIQCRVADEKVVVFEINPRFSGTTSLRAMVGYNEPDILIRKELFGEVIKPHFAYRTGIIVRGLQELHFEKISSFRAIDLL